MIEKEVEFPKWKNYFERSVESVLSAKLSSSTAFGKVLAYNGQVIEVSSLPGVLGSLCTISPENGETIKGEIWNDIHRITGTEGYGGSTIIEKNEINKTEKTYHLINNKPKLLKERGKNDRL